MKAIVQDHYGSAEVLQLAEIDKPTIGADQVLVRVRAASIHVGDWILMSGSPYVMRMATGLRRPKNPVPGTDVAGTVEAVGEGVHGLRPGDEVFGWCAGAFAEYVAASEDQFVLKPAASIPDRRSSSTGRRVAWAPSRCRSPRRSAPR
jgi:NADPH:quinone reductase-like Zn-dependent oxidoreductase